MALWSDAFTAADDTSIDGRTPDEGTGTWGIKAGAIVVKTNRMRDNNFAAGNRASTDDLGVANYDVIATFSQTAGSPQPLVFGLRGRDTTKAAFDGLEFSYDHANSEYVLAASAAAEAWPGDGTLMKLEIRAGIAKGYVSTNGGADWVEKVSTTSDPNTSTGTFAGLVLANFTGGGEGGDHMFADDFSVEAVGGEPASSAPPGRSTRRAFGRGFGRALHRSMEKINGLWRLDNEIVQPQGA